MPLKRDTEYDSSSKFTYSTRPKKRQHNDEQIDFMTDIKSAIKTFQTQFDSMQGTVSNIQKQNNDIIQSMEFMSKQYEEMRDIFVKLESDRKFHSAQIQTLKQKVENLERQHKQSSVELRNIPVQKSESKLNLLDSK
ncbi:hypothetical protein ACJJTC_001926 [Scirpophaga incertulas]